MIGLEYLLLFGVDSNKVELFDDDSLHVALAFPDVETAMAHRQHWLQTLSTWQAAPVSHPADKLFVVGGFRLEHAHCRIDLQVPFEGQNYRYAVLEMLDGLTAPELDGERRFGPDAVERHGEATRLAYMMAWGWQARVGGLHSSHIDLLLSGTTMVEPDLYYFRAGREACRIRKIYFDGVPDLILEILGPGSVMDDTRTRMALYHEAGVGEYWIADPESRTVEVHYNAPAGYECSGRYGPGESFVCRTVEQEVEVESLFLPPDEDIDCQPWRQGFPDPGAWFSPPESRFGLQQLLAGGHPERRYEYWNGRAICRYPLGSEVEAKRRLEQCVEDACRWEQAVGAAVGESSIDVGRFHLQRRGRWLELQVDVDGAMHRQMLTYYHFEGQWGLPSDSPPVAGGLDVEARAQDAERP